MFISTKGKITLSAQIAQSVTIFIVLNRRTFKNTEQLISERSHYRRILWQYFSAHIGQNSIAKIIGTIRSYYRALLGKPHKSYVFGYFLVCNQSYEMDYSEKQKTAVAVYIVASFLKKKTNGNH